MGIEVNTDKKVFIFASKEPAAEDEYFRAQWLFNEISIYSDIDTTFVNKLSFDEGDLRLVAAHKVVSTPTVIAQIGDEVVFRYIGIPTVRMVFEALQHPWLQYLEDADPV